MAFYSSGRFEQALDLYRKALELDPGFSPAYNNLAGVLRAMGRFEDALEVMGEHSRLDPEWTSPSEVEEARAGYAEGGARGYWEAALRSAAARVQDPTPNDSFDMALACAQLGRMDEAFEHLDRVVASRAPVAAQALETPLLATLRSDPRFAEIRRQLGFDRPGRER